jgi:hypothetical protein
MHGHRMDSGRTNEHGVHVSGVEPDKPLEESDRDRNIIETPCLCSEVDPAVRAAHWYDSRTMAKAKRRKLRARRSKANHGRKPNAGRG